MKSFIHVLKNGASNERSRTQNKTDREMYQLLEMNCKGGKKRNFSRGSASKGTQLTLEAHKLAAFGASHVVLPGCNLGCGGLVDLLCERFSEM